jgi:hypothetical protein
MASCESRIDSSSGKSTSGLDVENDAVALLMGRGQPPETADRKAYVIARCRVDERGRPRVQNAGGAVLGGHRPDERDASRFEIAKDGQDTTVVALGDR